MAEKPYELIIFDWDGTLMDSAGHIVKSVQEALADLNLPKVPAEKIRRLIGRPREDALKAELPDLTPEKAQALTKRYEEIFFSQEELPIAPFEGALDTLKTLNKEGYILAVATSKSRYGLDIDLEHFKMKDLFAVTRCGDEGFSKPHPGMLMDVLQITAMETSQALMIGDSEYDLIMARQAGIDSLAVSYGVQNKDLLLECKPVDCLDDIGELPGWLNNRS